MTPRYAQVLATAGTNVCVTHTAATLSCYPVRIMQKQHTAMHSSSRAHDTQQEYPGATMYIRFIQERCFVRLYSNTYDTQIITINSRDLHQGNQIWKRTPADTPARYVRVATAINTAGGARKHVLPAGLSDTCDNRTAVHYFTALAV